MNQYLKHYNMKIKVMSPIFIGDGKKIGKKEYIHLEEKNKVIVPDMNKLFDSICLNKLEDRYIDFVMKMNEKSYGLFKWLNENGYRESDYVDFSKYEVDASDALIGDGIKGKSSRTRDISTFIKDNYGNPYIPGSSIKGMIRTALLSKELIDDPDRFDVKKRNLLNNSKIKENRNKYLAKEIKSIEVECFHTLRKKDSNPSDMVNCNLAGLIVSDSKPISVDRLTLSQKIDYTLDGKENVLPLLRETLKPETEIYFDITIDSKVCPYTIEDILDALNIFQRVCYKNFYSRFNRGKDADGIIWLGGGCGFLSKTILYPMFGKDAYNIVYDVFRYTLGQNFEKHKHMRDKELKLSPRVCKCTKYQGKLCDMGMGLIEVV